MIKTINIREIILEILMEITEEEEYSHIVIRNALEKYQFLEKRDRAFISRVCVGTIENMILLDYMIEQFSKVKVINMKPVYPESSAYVCISAAFYGHDSGFGCLQRGSQDCAEKRIL